MLFRDELGVNPSAESYKCYRNKCIRRLECFRTKFTAKRLEVIPSGLFPLTLRRGLLFNFGGQLPSSLEGRTLFVSRQPSSVREGRVLFVPR